MCLYYVSIQNIVSVGQKLLNIGNFIVLCIYIHTAHFLFCNFQLEFQTHKNICLPSDIGDHFDSNAMFFSETCSCREVFYISLNNQVIFSILPQRSLKSGLVINFANIETLNTFLRERVILEHRMDARVDKNKQQQEPVGGWARGSSSLRCSLFLLYAVSLSAQILIT